MSEAFLPALIVLPAAAALAAAAVQPAPRGRRGKWARERNIALAGGAAAVGLGLFRWQFARLFSSEPAYRLERRIGCIEVRRYAPVVQAVTTVSPVDTSEWRGALDEGFRRLAGYIFGSNTPRSMVEPGERTDVPGRRIPMTAPVMVQSVRRAPLPLASSASASDRAEEARSQSSTHDVQDAIAVAFVMPDGAVVSTLPRPIDERIRFRKLGAQRVAVLRFSGRMEEDLVREKQAELLRAVEKAGLRARGVPLFAGYDPPSTLPMLRRLEVWVEVTDAI